MSTTLPRRTERDLLIGGTVALAVLLAWSIRSMPVALTWALPPYLALVARHLLVRPGPEADGPRPAETLEPRDSDSGPAPDPGPSGLPIESEAPANVPSPPLSPSRPRRRARPRAITEPEPAAWVQVGPGRFVRGEQPRPEPPPAAIEADPPCLSDHPEPTGVEPERPGGADPDGLTEGQPPGA